MGKLFSTKLAWRNIQSNKQVYLPYTLAATITVSMFQMMISLILNDFVQDRSSTLVQLFSMGAIVVGLFSLIFIFYTNSFLMKRRKKELGLYNILGLEKKHIRKVLLLENLMIGAISIALGIFLGNILGQLSFLFLNYLLQLPVVMTYSVSWLGAGVTAAVFMGIFLLTLIYNTAQVTFSNPITLLKGGKEGEKEPKSSPILFILGLISLISGYTISMTIDNPVQAILQFFLAVLLVIIGTYLIFTAGSIIVLKLLKKNKAFYYQPGPFISVSGMLYRMKQHAVGLANITILAVMVIIAISTTVTLFVGTEETLENRFPAENTNSLMTNYGLSGSEVEASIQEITEHIDELTVDFGLEVESMDSFRFVNLIGKFENDAFNTVSPEEREFIPDMVLLVPLDDYNRMERTSINLEDNEVLVYEAGIEVNSDRLGLGDNLFLVNELEDRPSVVGAEADLSDTLVVITPSAEAIDEITAAYNTEEDPYVMYWQGGMYWETTATEGDVMSYGKMMQAAIGDHGEEVGVFYESRSGNREEWYSLNGGFLFLGLFLGGLFTVGAALITYFKQVSEGFDDRERIQIMQKVGLDKETTKRATRSQIVWMFTLPIVTAALHTAFAYSILQKMLVLFSINNPQLLITVTIAVVASFAFIYWIIYRITSKVYLKIVE
ncbi:FtsX-like permease family protein [Alkalibacterium sp. MB6]|uniref:FtsX-like permease family protein n=1 Tax=Alkalibacterium sp. MB6 TaxID=2081965 RepID=UPI00137B92F0|nr:ABC transporter permease [Alkalibacterium sp. MB6]